LKAEPARLIGVILLPIRTCYAVEIEDRVSYG
jgi:hypothetical protein